MNRLANTRFADGNMDTRCPCILLLDTSGSMSGSSIAELNAGFSGWSEQQDAAASDLYRRHGTADWAASAPCWRDPPKH